MTNGTSSPSLILISLSPVIARRRPLLTRMRILEDWRFLCSQPLIWKYLTLWMILRARSSRCVTLGFPRNMVRNGRGGWKPIIAVGAAVGISKTKAVLGASGSRANPLHFRARKLGCLGALSKMARSCTLAMILLRAKTGSCFHSIKTTSPLYLAMPISGFP